MQAPCGKLSVISVLQLEADGSVKHVRRDPKAIGDQRGADFLGEGKFGTTHIQVKSPVGSEIRKEQSLTPGIEKQGKLIGKKIPRQISNWITDPKFKDKITRPNSPNKVLVVVDLFDVPVNKKDKMKRAVDKGYTNAIQF